jgi:hypothetical protein
MQHDPVLHDLLFASLHHAFLPRIVRLQHDFTSRNFIA